MSYDTRNQNGRDWGHAGVHSFYFVKPIPSTNADSLVKMLMNIDGIDEARVTEANHVFLVKVISESRYDVGNHIAKSMNDRYNMNLNYYGRKK